MYIYYMCARARARVCVCVCVCVCKLQVRKIYNNIYKNTNIVYTYSKYIQYSDIVLINHL